VWSVPSQPPMGENCGKKKAPVFSSSKGADEVKKAVSGGGRAGS